MKFYRNNLIDFYDNKRSEIFANYGLGGDVSAITGLIGEDLLVAILFHYWRNGEHLNPERLPDPCKEDGVKNGKKLDAWLVRDDQTIFQVEIKNWSAHSENGRSVPINAKQEKIQSNANKRWIKYFGDNGCLPEQAKKISLPMQRPQGFENHKLERMLLFWFPIADEKFQPLSVVEATNGQRLHVFSASIYLRTLSEEFIDLDTPIIQRRYDTLDRLIKRDKA